MKKYWTMVENTKNKNVESLARGNKLNDCIKKIKSKV